MTPQCPTGKRRYLDPAWAEGEYHRLRSNSHDHPDRLNRLNIYLCKLCGGYHIGHRRTGSRRRGRYKRMRVVVPPPLFTGLMKIHVENFQSLGQVDINAEGLTVLVGPSDRGKSALIRAIDAALFNRPGADFVRAGAKAAVVELTGLPAVDGTAHSVRWKKGKSANEFTIDGATHARVGKDAPQPLADFGYKDIFIGDKQRKQGEYIRPQVATQFEPPFLLTRAGSFVADVLNVVTRHAVLQTAVGRAASDLGKRKAEVGTLTRLKSEAETRAASLVDVPAFVQRVAALKAEQDRLETRRLALTRLRMLQALRLKAQSVAQADVPAPVPTTTMKTGMAVFMWGRQRRRLRPVLAVLLPERTPEGNLTQRMWVRARLREGERQRPGLQRVLATSTVLSDVRLQFSAQALWHRVSRLTRLLTLHTGRALLAPLDPLPAPVEVPALGAVFRMRETMGLLLVRSQEAVTALRAAETQARATDTLAEEASAELATFKTEAGMCPACERPW